MISQCCIFDIRLCPLHSLVNRITIVVSLTIINQLFAHLRRSQFQLQLTGTSSAGAISFGSDADGSEMVRGGSVEVMAFEFGSAGMAAHSFLVASPSSVTAGWADPVGRVAAGGVATGEADGEAAVFAVFAVFAEGLWGSAAGGPVVESAMLVVFSSRWTSVLQVQICRYGPSSVS